MTSTLCSAHRERFCCHSARYCERAHLHVQASTDTASDEDELPLLDLAKRSESPAAALAVPVAVRRNSPIDSGAHQEAVSQPLAQPVSIPEITLTQPSPTEAHMGDEPSTGQHRAPSEEHAGSPAEITLMQPPPVDNNIGHDPSTGQHTAASDENAESPAGIVLAQPPPSETHTGHDPSTDQRRFARDEYAESPAEIGLAQPPPPSEAHMGHGQRTGQPRAAREEHAGSLVVPERVPATSQDADMLAPTGDQAHDTGSPSSSPRPACSTDDRSARAQGLANTDSHAPGSSTPADVAPERVTTQQAAPNEREGSFAALQQAQPTNDQPAGRPVGRTRSESRKKREEKRLSLFPSDR